jgi:bifunctional UDP-N-acetylglucosamine pyrophosphorylase/glucosamine-1-phosphate N-acetyltransferase
MSNENARRRFAVMILAAGEGTRMKSARSKVLHEIGGLSMIGHVIHLARDIGAAEVVIVRSAKGEAIEEQARRLAPEAKFAIQDPPLGTGHAVQAGLSALDGFDGDILVLYADTPMLRLENLAALRDGFDTGASVCVLGFHPQHPAEYGRLVVAGWASSELPQLQAIVEFGDANEVQRAIDFCNSGVMAIAGDKATDLLGSLTNENAKGEYYLTDLVGLARHAGLDCVAVEAQEDDVIGVNSRVELAQAEAIFQARARHKAMSEGVTLLDPATTYFSFDTHFGRDIVVGPNVMFGVGVSVGDGATIKAFSHIEGAIIAAGAEVGPFARLRPGAEIGEGAKVGNFVEIKKATIESGAKVNHLTYIGDARVGTKSNIGAGTITCNYDGYNKFFTDIGADVFVGSNTALVAPVKISDGANIAAGSTITKDVPSDTLAVARGRQSNLAGKAKSYRAKLAAEKAKKK